MNWINHIVNDYSGELKSKNRKPRGKRERNVMQKDMVGMVRGLNFEPK